MADEDNAMATFVASSVLKFFNDIPRFGHSSNITVIFDPSDGSVNVNMLKEYALGLLFIPGICLVTLFLWLLLLLVSKCLGRRGGIMAGYSLREKLQSPSKSTLVKCNFVRGFLLLSSVTVIICGCLFLFRGRSSIQDVLNDFRDGADGIGSVVDNLLMSTDSLIELGTTSNGLKVNFEELIHGGICTTNAIQEVDYYAQLVVDFLTYFQFFSNSDLSDLKGFLSGELSSIDSKLDNWTDRGAEFAKPEYIAAPILAFGILFTIGQLLAWFGFDLKVYFCFQRWFFLPLFGVLVFLACIITSVLGAILTVNSDFCLGGYSRSPEGTLKIVASFVDLSGTAKEALDYYFLDSCVGTFSKLSDVTDLYGNVTQYLPLLNIFTDALTNETIATACELNQERVDQLTESLDNISDAFGDLLAIIQNTTSALQCPLINGIFVDFAHGAMCDSAPNALLWLFSSCFGVFVVGMSIIVFRGGMVPPPNAEISDESNIYNSKVDGDTPPSYDVEEESLSGDESLNLGSYHDHHRAKVY